MENDDNLIFFISPQKSFDLAPQQLSKELSGFSLSPSYREVKRWERSAHFKNITAVPLPYNKIEEESVEIFSLPIHRKLSARKGELRVTTVSSHLKRVVNSGIDASIDQISLPGTVIRGIIKGIPVQSSPRIAENISESMKPQYQANPSSSEIGFALSTATATQPLVNGDIDLNYQAYREDLANLQRYAQKHGTAFAVYANGKRYGEIQSLFSAANMLANDIFRENPEADVAIQRYPDDEFVEFPGFELIEE